MIISQNEYICDVCHAKYDGAIHTALSKISVKMGEEDLFGNVPLGKVLVSCKQGLVEHKDLCPDCINMLLDECSAKIRETLASTKTTKLYDKESAVETLNKYKAIITSYTISTDGTDVVPEGKWVSSEEIASASYTVSLLDGVLNSTLSNYNLYELSETITMLFNLLESEVLILQAIAKNGTSGLVDITEEIQELLPSDD